MTDTEIEEFEMDCNCAVGGYIFRVREGYMFFGKDGSKNMKKIRLNKYLIQELNQIKIDYYSNDGNRVVSVARICFNEEF